MTDIFKYVDDNGNFTHTKIEGTKEEAIQFIDMYKNSEFYSRMTDSQKIIIRKLVFPRLLETGMFPSGLLLSLVMPPVSKEHKFSVYGNVASMGDTITFDLPPRFKQHQKETKLMKEVNANKEYILIGDISVSMTTKEAACNDKTRYEYMLEKFKQITNEAASYDEHNSCTVILFGEKCHVYEDINASNLDEKLNNASFEGFTYLHLALNKAFEIHKQQRREYKKEDKEHPGTVFIVFTDGDPSNRNAVKESLSNIIASIDSEDEVQVILVTVGTQSRELAQWLKGLHDALEDDSINPNDYDILHVKNIEDANFIDLLRLKDHE